MPVKKSAFKRLRQDKKKHISNKAVISEVRTLAKKASSLIAKKETKDAGEALRVLESKMDRAARKNIIKKETASRKVSRLKAQLNKISAK